MKTIEYKYKEEAINFLINSKEDNVMVNATEMAKQFGKRVDNFIRLESTKEFIEIMMKDNDLQKYDEEKRMDYILLTKSGGKTYMHRYLAIDFAMWISVDFKVWVSKTIDFILNGYLKEYRIAMQAEFKAKVSLSNAKENLMSNPSAEAVKKYFAIEDEIKTAQRKKRRAVQNQLNLFEEHLKLE